LALGRDESSLEETHVKLLARSLASILIASNVNNRTLLKKKEEIKQSRVMSS
jgi:hypothetical protein